MKYNPIGTLVSVLKVHLTWKNGEKKERTKRKLNGKMWKGKGEQRKDCFLLLLSFIYPVSLLPCCFFLSFSASGSLQKKTHLAFPPFILGKPSTVNLQKMGSQGQSSELLPLSSGRFPFKGGPSLSSQFPPQSRHTSWFQASDPANGHYFWMPKSPGVSCPRAFYALNQTETYPTD